MTTEKIYETVKSEMTAVAEYCVPELLLTEIETEWNKSENFNPIFEFVHAC